MRFYKLTSVLTGDDYYIRPDMIEFYRYTDDGVMLSVNNIRLEVSKSDFTNMLILEGIDVYWQTHNTQHTIEFLLTIKTISFY